MASIFDGIEDDPCALVPVLKQQRLKLITGLQLASSRYGSDESRRVQADLDRLDREIAINEEKCRAKQEGRRPRARRSFTAGFRG